MPKLACVVVVRDEARHIAEWLAWQFMLGFETVLLIDHGSVDETSAIARGFATRHDIRLARWPSAERGFQNRAYIAAARGLAGEFDWVAFFDADEFLVLDQGLDLKSLLAARSEAAVAIAWRIFGSAGHREIPPGLVTENFNRRAVDSFSVNRHVKSIIRPALATAAINPHAFEMRGETVDLFGAPLAWHSPGYLAAPPVFRGASLHHYFTRSWAHWQLRLKRGNIGQTRTEQDFHDHDRNEIADDSAARHAPQLRTMIGEITPAAPAAAPPPRLGIAITSFNRRDLVIELVRRLRNLTQARYDLVVCDDGSTDGTIEALRLLGVTVVSGPNRGIAWNKNRGLYYLLNHTECDIVLLLDDDVRPLLPGWEDAWIEAARRHGHVNLAFYRDRIVAGANTPADPGLASMIPGVALAFSRQALAEIGYFELRFARYGHEHSDMSFRAIRAGYGGIALQNGGNTETLFFVIDGGLELAPSTSSGTAAELKANEAVLAQSGHEPIYRHAWRDDAQMQALLAEIAGARGDGARCQIHTNSFDSLGAYYAQRDTASDEPGRTIFDIGMSEGNDTAFYLAKGFQVVGVEPDVRMYYHLRERFAAEIEARRLIVHNLAAAARQGDIVAFHANEVHQGLSGLNHGHAASAGQVRSYHVATIDWPALIARHGLPHYVKIDIEGAEADFLSSWPAGTALPAFVSVECHSLNPVQALQALGYRRFQLIDQNPPGGFALPVVQLEGRPVVWPSFSHASGPFGRDLPGPWVDFQTFTRQFEAAQARRHETWFDGHAAL